MRNPDKIRAARVAEDLAMLVYDFTDEFPPIERFGLAFHLRKTSISIGSNLFEGCGLPTNKAFIASVGRAHGEANEMLFQLRIALRRAYGNHAIGLRVRTKLYRLRQMLFDLIEGARRLPDD